VIPLDLDTWLRIASIGAGTILSEDLTCIASGLLIHAGKLTWFAGLTGCTLGIFVGDLGLWLCGRLLGRRVLNWNWVRKRLPAGRIEHFGAWFDRRGWSAILAARFVPGTRFPVYVSAGILGRRVDRFLIWAAVAALLWTPLLVGIVAVLGDAVAAPLQRVLGGGWIAFIIALGVLLLLVRTLTLCWTETGRARLWAAVSRTWRWEFWPAWLFYLPLLPWLAWLAIRHRGLMTATAANPAIPHGGVVGESKFEILSRLPSDWVTPSALIPPGSISQRMACLLGVMSQRGWVFPLVLKPDAGQRGMGVRRVSDTDGAARYFAEFPQPVLVQMLHPGPFEAGIFYYRFPEETRGQVFSITDKHFPILDGNGASTVESLLWRHPRFRMQARTFLARMNGQAERVLAAGERLPLALAGNHCQGTMFRDGSHLITPELGDAIDSIARSYDGFYFGRFDVRYADVEAFKAGRGFAIVELNGVTSESTNLYDPSWSLPRAYRTLFRQWAILFEIGARNRGRGHRPSSLREVIREARKFYRARPACTLSD